MYTAKACFCSQFATFRDPPFCVCLLFYRLLRVIIIIRSRLPDVLAAEGRAGHHPQRRAHVRRLHRRAFVLLQRRDGGRGDHKAGGPF